MHNDKVFITYAIALAVSVACLITFVVGTGASHIPEPAYLLEHVALGLMIRAYYKSFDGESGYFSVASTVKSYFGIAREAIPSAAVPLAH